jgi:protease IV
MKQFFKFMLASMTGVILVNVIFFFIIMGLIMSAASFSKKEVVIVPKNSLLHLTFEKEIPDRTSENPFSNFNFSSMKSGKAVGLNDILENITKAKTDDNIKGIYLDLATVPAGIATIDEIRNALLDFKKSGKFIYSYSEAYSQKAYYLASVSDKIFLNPMGTVDFRGLSAEIMFYKGLLSKVDVEMQVIRHGKFKSAVEPYILDKMSDANREQTLKYMSSIWNYMLEGIASSKKLSVEELNIIADSMKIRKAEDAVTYKLVDKLMYKDEMIAELRKKLGIGEKDKISYISMAKYNNVSDKSKKLKLHKDKIAVVYAAGEIGSGEGDENSIGSETTSEALRKARLDSTVKAIVFRVNSPGGSALASEVIWREVILAKKVKPVVVSMGNLAASGGYWISCPATKILASPTTITGSIGVFGLVPNLKGLLNNKLGITVDNVKTNNYADFGSTSRALTESERGIYQEDVELIYQNFLTHVSGGRGMTTNQVDTIGQGRVWSGVDAKKIGLIDDFGGLTKAIEIAAKLAKITEYRIVSLPEEKEPFAELIEKIIGDDGANAFIKNELGEEYVYYQYLKASCRMNGIQARLPYFITIH